MTWIISSQVLNLVGTVIRKNVRCLCCWRLRNHKEVETLCEELSGVYDKETIMELYRYATAEPYSSHFARSDAKTREYMFWGRFEKRLTLQHERHALADGIGSVEQARQVGQPPSQKAK